MQANTCKIRRSGTSIVVYRKVNRTDATRATEQINIYILNKNLVK